MLIKSLSLDNFRSYPKKEFFFSPGINVVVGPNTAGKSNLLEAIFLLSFGRSPRADLDREMVKKDEGKGNGIAFVAAVTEGSEERELEVAVTQTGKRFRVNGVGRRLGEFSRHFYTVLFSPEDLNLVIGSPDLRRRFVDLALSSVDGEYAHHLSEFDKVRKRRNRLLKAISKEEAREEDLGFWDAKLLEHGSPIQDKRKVFFNDLNSQLRNNQLIISYLSSGLTSERLLAERGREIAAQTTLHGPHRDDFNFLREEGDEKRDLAAYGSRGEQRQAVLALKEAELEFVDKKIGSRPVLLLDDIFSELDEGNRARVFAMIRGGQTILTTTDADNIPVDILPSVHTISL